MSEFSAGGTNPRVSLQVIFRGISSKSLEQLLHLSELDYKIDAAAQYLQPIRTENDLRLRDTLTLSFLAALACTGLSGWGAPEARRRTVVGMQMS